MANKPTGSTLGLPKRPVQRFTGPLVRFLHIQSTSGIVLILATVVALVAANSVWGPDYHAFWNTHLHLSFGDFKLDYPIWYWINDALMTIFFFVIGLEIKREITLGELNEPRKVVLPVLAALGGAVVPVAIFLVFQSGQPGERAWAVPMATDIAFVVGILALLGSRVPRGLKILMLSVAIVDDILAVGVIAAFYTDSIAVLWALGVLVALVVTAGLNRIGVRNIGVYLVVGAAAWLCAYNSGIHPTLAGVLLGLFTPVRALFDRQSIAELLARGQETIAEAEDPDDDDEARAALGEISFATTEAVSPLIRLESALHPWVAFIIMPLFALANAGVEVNIESLSNPLGLAIAAGLVLGKPVGIVLASWLGIKLGLASLPDDVSWRYLIGGACLAGIGFTMALFIAGLGLQEQQSLLPTAKSGILLGSVVSGFLGVLILTVGRKHSFDQ